MNIFQNNDYKSALKWSLEQNKQAGRPINMTKLAEACKVQKTYISRVLNHDGQLNSDQIHLACQFLGLKVKEAKYVSLLHDAERTALTDRKTQLQAEAKKMQSSARTTENYISTKPTEAGSIGLLKYHLTPNLQLVHLFLTVPKYAGNLKSIEEKLFFSREELAGYLVDLSKLGLIEWDGKKWKVLQESIHLDKNSEIYPMYKTLLRAKLFERFLKSDKKSTDYNLSVIFSADEKTRNTIHEKFLEFLKSIEPLVKKAPAEEIYQLNFDLMKWS